MIIQNIALLFSFFLPKRFVLRIKKFLVYAGSRDDPKIWFGKRIFFALLFGLILFLIPYSIFPLSNTLFNTKFYFAPQLKFVLMLGLFVFGFVLAQMLFFLHLNYVIDGRKKLVESILPDFLYLVGSNLKSGMTPFYAFRAAVRPEFGPLSEEIKVATKKGLGLQSFSESLRDISLRIDSKMLKDTTNFFSYALRSGGKLAQLVEANANDIKQTNLLKRELIVSTKMYLIFIAFIVIIASPLLLAISIQFLSVISVIETKTSTLSPNSQNLDAVSITGMGFSGVDIDAEFMTNISLIIILFNSILAGVFIGVIGGEKIIHGLKFAPIIFVLAVVVFYLVLGVMNVFVQGMIPI
ncbi:MAG: type II secretion system F family protein [Candidatus ainarchaeum sp.]|nr:type II secretion system F family protein [Candidatus ainarchaeum sp.]